MVRATAISIAVGDGVLVGQQPPNSVGALSMCRPAFRFPFVTEPINKNKIRAWGKAPAGPTLAIERRKGVKPVVLRQIQVSAGAVLVAKLPGQQRLRAEGGLDAAATFS
jgi:hypothetical protein